MEELKIATQAAKEAGEVLRSRFWDKNPVSLKKDSSFVTDSDKLSEKIIITRIKEHFPDHSVRAEESGFTDNKSDYLWVIDPLDGTTNYAAQIPFFSISIALVAKGKLNLGVVYDPLHERLFSASVGQGTRINGKSAHVSAQTELSKSQIGYARPSIHKGDFVKIFSQIEMKSRTPKILGSMALQLAYVSTGMLEGSLLIKPSFWDVAAGILLVQESGGKVTDIEGKDWTENSQTILASNGKIHEQVLDAIN